MATCNIYILNNGELKQNIWDRPIVDDVDCVQKLLSRIKTIPTKRLQNKFYGCTLTGSLNLAKLETVDDYGMEYCFSTSQINGVSFPKLTSIGINGMYFGFMGAPDLTGPVSFASLTSVSEYGLSRSFESTMITSVSFDSLQVLDQQLSLEMAFANCTNLTKASFPQLHTVSYSSLNYAFYGCTSLTEVTFPKLKNMNSGMYCAFENCTSLTTLAFPSLQIVVENSYAMTNMCSGCSNLKEIHFPKALEGNSECTASNLGCPDTTQILFDL